MTYKSKYYNIKTRTSDGLVFDSHKEARRWEELLLQHRAGMITEVRRQVEYELIPAQYEYYPRYSKKGERLKDGRKLIERKVSYIADFVYTNADTGELKVEDVKGYKQGGAYDVFVIKRKLMYAINGIKVDEV